MSARIGAQTLQLARKNVMEYLSRAPRNVILAWEAIVEDHDRALLAEKNLKQQHERDVEWWRSA